MTNLYKFRPISDGLFEINHKLAGIVPMALESEQVALTEDIAANGQREPILLWQGKIVDGRCRQTALASLKLPILYKELDDDLPIENVKIIVKSMNTRRNLTETQKVASAAKEYAENKATKTIKQIAASWGISTSILDNAWWILRHRPDYIEALFNGKTVEIVNAKGFITQSHRVTAIYAYLRREKEFVLPDNTFGYQTGTRVRSQQGKDWLYELLRRNKDLPLEIKMLLEETANYKFRRCPGARAYLKVNKVGKQ